MTTTAAELWHRVLAQADAYARGGDVAAAEQLCQDLVAEFPACAQAWNRLAILAATRGNTLLAQACLERAIEAEPNDATLHANLAELLRRAGLAERALASGSRALRLDSHHAGANLNHGLALVDLGRAAKALPHLERVTTQEPGNAAAWFGVARALRALGQTAAAARALQRCATLAPDDIEVPVLQARLCLQLDDADAARAAAADALRRDPRHAEAAALLADALMQRGQIGAAEAALREALQIQPGLAALRYRLALCRLDQGDYDEGFALYESRTGVVVANRLRRPLLPMPVWNGEDLRGRSLLVLTEQGYGDHLLFCRFIPRLAAAGAAVVLAVSPPLVDLMASLAGDARVVTLTDDTRASGCDFWTYVGSLPHRLGIAAGVVTPAAPYLRANPAKRAAWRERLGRDPRRRRVGLVWSGRPEHDYERRRAIPAAAFAPLAALPDIHWFGLQMTPRPGDAQATGLPIDIFNAADLGSFDDTAALVAELDLLISVDTAYAHLAGAIGCPVWLLLPRVADWRWSLADESTPWYPTMRIFRQRSIGDWAEVLRRAVAVLGAVSR